MTCYFNDKNIFNINSINRYASGFPLDINNNTTTLSLDGDWKFLFCESATKIPANFFADSFDYSKFDNIKVPSNWQFFGYDIPMYSNIAYPYALVSKNLLRVPFVVGRKNPAGLYFTEFEINETDKNIFVQLGGANSCAEVYINGKFVGYSEDSFDFQEYNITDFVKKGKNKIAICVYRFCTGSYLEDQDMWRLGGLFRSVNVIFKPKTEIADFYFRSELSSDYAEGKLLANVTVKGEKAMEMRLKLEVFFADKLIATFDKTVASEVTEFEEKISDIMLWSHEYPNLYNIYVTLSDANGNFVDRRKHNFGFREVKITPMENGKGPFILLNGKPLKFCGVNRHEFHPDCGHAVTREMIYSDVKLCLENNITAIRTSHYPNSRAFYEVCDELGMLVMCENNLESHGLSFMLPNSSKMWTKHCLYRVNNMVNTYKNHPCIVSWSLGNEAGFGNAYVEMKKAVLAIDKTRFIHYEEDITGKVSDVFSEMYAPLEKMEALGKNERVMHCQTTIFRPAGVVYKPEMYKDLPYIECEYAHCMGNSLGNFKDYWDEFKRYDRLAGGFIWDFADQAFKYVNSDGVTEYRYGGDFGERPNAGCFAFNGIVRGDRTPNPALYEVRKVYQQVDFTLEGNLLTLNNRFLFTNLNEFALNVEVRVDGDIVNDQTYNLPSILPGEKGAQEITLPETNGELFIRVGLTLLNNKGTLKQGHEMAYEGFLVNKSDLKLNNLTGNVNVTETAWEIGISGKSIGVNIDKKTGGITSIYKDNKEILKLPIMPNFYRAVTDNEKLAQVNSPLIKYITGVYRFRNAMRTLAPKSFEVKQLDGCIKVTINWKMRLLSKLVTEYIVGDDGIDISMSVKGYLPLTRYGFTFETRKEVTDMDFYAKGPHENYCDRKDSALLGHYSGTAENFIHDYWAPQENGNHTEARYLNLGSEGNQITILAKDKPFEFSVHPYSIATLDGALHLHQLSRADNYTVNIDGRQKGVGGDIPAMACLKPPYKIKAGVEHSLKVRMLMK